MKVAGLKPEKVIASCPQHEPRRIDDGSLPGIVRPDKDVQAAPEPERQGVVRSEAPKSGCVNFRNMHVSTPPWREDYEPATEPKATPRRVRFGPT